MPLSGWRNSLIFLIFASWKDTGICHGFSASYEITWFCSLLIYRVMVTRYLISCVTWIYFCFIELVLHFWHNCTLSWCIIIFKCYWIYFVSIMLRIITSAFSWGILVCSFLVMLLSGFIIRLLLPLATELGNLFYLFITFFKRVGEIFSVFDRIHQWGHLILGFSLWKDSLLQLNLFTCFKSVQIFSSFLSPFNVSVRSICFTWAL